MQSRQPACQSDVHGVATSIVPTLEHMPHRNSISCQRSQPRPVRAISRVFWLEADRRDAGHSLAACRTFSENHAKWDLRSEIRRNFQFYNSFERAFAQSTSENLRSGREFPKSDRLLDTEYLQESIHNPLKPASEEP